MTTSRAPGASRRRLLGAAAGLAVILLGGARRPALAARAEVDAALRTLLGDVTPQSGRIRLDAPEIAENGNTVPLDIVVDSPMSADNYVRSVHVFADGNPRPEVVSFHFTPRSGRAAAATRMRLAQTQNVIAVAQMSDGSVYMAEREVKVTIGGCGG
jgi:sulfur-oxidizing protein SoxY